MFLDMMPSLKDNNWLELCGLHIVLYSSGIFIGAMKCMQLMELLQYDEIELHVCHLEFIQSEDTILRKACDFCSPQNNIFKEFCLPSQLPPTPFCEPEWMEFMKIAGMQCEVNAQLFIMFAGLNKFQVTYM
jgi:hypothetical protein